MENKGTQDYFWTPEWQEDEREADEDIKAGRTITFSNAKVARYYLKSLDYCIKEGTQDDK